MKKNIIIGILVIFCIIFFAFGYIQRRAVNSKQEEAESLRIEVEECKLREIAAQREADRQRELALKNEQRAIHYLSQLQEQLKKRK